MNGGVLQGLQPLARQYGCNQKKNKIGSIATNPHRVSGRIARYSAVERVRALTACRIP
jgi:hypothetical protein